MDIAAISSVMSRANLLNQVGTAVASKAMDDMKTEGQGIVNLIDAASMERSVNPSVGGNFDMSI